MTNQLGTQRNVEQGVARAIADAHRYRLVPESASDAFEAWASELGHLVADRGIETVERAVGAVCASARRRQLEPMCVDILADRGEPAVARERALGRVLTALNASRANAATIEVA